MAFTFPIRVQTSTINRWLKHEVSPIYRKSIILGMLKARGRIENNFAGGDRVNWNMRFKRRDIRDINGPVSETTFPVTSVDIPASLQMSGYDMGESIKKAERLANQGKEVQIYNLAERVLSQLAGDFTEAYRLRLWQDGNITGTGMMGLLSLFGGSSTASRGRYTNPGTYTPITCADGVTTWWACSPSATYAGVSTALGNKVNDYNNADTSQAYPLGDYSEGYDFNSPLIVDRNSRQFTPTGSSSTYSWDTCWQQAFNALVTWMAVARDMPVDVVVWHGELDRRAKDSLIGNQRFIVSDSSETRSLGFKTLEYNGTETYSEWGVPNDMAFALPFDKMSLKNWQGQLIEKEDDHDIVTSDDLYKLDAYTQLQVDSAGFVGALVQGTTEGT